MKIKTNLISNGTYSSYFPSLTTISLLIQKIIFKGWKYLLFLLLNIFIQSCQNENPIPADERPGIFLTLKDKSCTEAWLDIKVQGIPLPVEALIYNDDSLLTTISITQRDTLLFLDSLRLNTSYNFRAAIKTPWNNYTDFARCTTLDTTSSNFSWYTWTFSGDATCAMYDAFIYDEDNIFTVGYLTRVDPSGTFQHYYPILKWNGTDWDSIELFYSLGVIPRLSGIWVVDPSHIYLAHGSIAFWDGASKTAPIVYQRPWQTDPEAFIYDLWGYSDSLIYGIGDAGYLVTKGKYSYWEKIETGTRYKIVGITGATDNNTVQLNVFCTVDEGVYLGQNGIFKITARTRVHPISWNSEPIGPIWTPNGWLIYACGEGVYNNKNGQWVKELPTGGTSIKGNGLNDIFNCGLNGQLRHFNGLNWTTYYNLPNSISYDFYSISCKGNVVVAVGRYYEEALIVMGIRN